MCKRNKIGLFGGLLASVALSGCAMHGSMQAPPLVQRVHTSTPGAEDQTPLIVDEAMQIRDWDRATAYYASGSTIAGPTGFLYEAAWNQPEWRYPLIEPPLFIVQSLALPITLTITPPWTPIRYSGEVVGPTYTAMPPLPSLPQQ